MAKLKRRRRKKGEVASRKEAVRNFCLECMGYQIAEVRRCTATQCWLYPWRLGALDEETLKQEKIEVKAEKPEKTEEVPKIKKSNFQLKG